MEYTIQETEHYGVWVFAAVNGGDETGTDTVRGTVAEGVTTVSFRNRANFELPETGRSGNALMYTAGALLTATSLALMYMNRKRRKEGTGN